MTEKEYLVALSAFKYFGPARTKLLISYFGSARSAWKTNKDTLSKMGLRGNIVNEFIEFKSNFDFKYFFRNLNDLSINIITLNEETYPINLKDLPDAPLVLYIRGNLKRSDENAVAIVGSRKMTSYGKEVTNKFSSELAGLGVTVVSGLALGVDLAAHQACLEAGGRCIAVLAGGNDRITPRTNEWLGLKIIASGGVIISEYPPGVIPQKHYFPYRNRIISGLSKAVIVTEGAIKSGTIHTVKHALDQGRTVFAVPGPITSPMSEAPNFLIKNGARPLTSLNDILDELHMQLKVNEQISEVLPGNAKEQKIHGLLVREHLHIDELARISGLTVSEISASLTVMELKGMVRNLGGGIYKRI